MLCLHVLSFGKLSPQHRCLAEYTLLIPADGPSMGYFKLARGLGETALAIVRVSIIVQSRQYLSELKPLIDLLRNDQSARYRSHPLLESSIWHTSIRSLWCLVSSNSFHSCGGSFLLSSASRGKRTGMELHDYFWRFVLLLRISPLG